MENTVLRAFELQKRKFLQTGTKLTINQVPMFDFQDDKELEQKIEQINKYYHYWVRLGVSEELVKAYDSLVKQNQELRMMIKDLNFSVIGQTLINYKSEVPQFNQMARVEYEKMKKIVESVNG